MTTKHLVGQVVHHLQHLIGERERERGEEEEMAMQSQGLATYHGGWNFNNGCK